MQREKNKEENCVVYIYIYYCVKSEMSFIFLLDLDTTLVVALTVRAEWIRSFTLYPHMRRKTYQTTASMRSFSFLSERPRYIDNRAGRIVTISKKKKGRA